jgi:hypothetical protein
VCSEVSFICTTSNEVPGGVRCRIVLLCTSTFFFVYDTCVVGWKLSVSSPFISKLLAITRGCPLLRRLYLHRWFMSNMYDIVKTSSDPSVAFSYITGISTLIKLSIEIICLVMCWVLLRIFSENIKMQIRHHLLLLILSQFSQPNGHLYFYSLNLSIEYRCIQNIHNSFWCHSQLWKNVLPSFVRLSVHIK